MRVISRKDAKTKGLKYYFTGKHCKYGHTSKRQVNNGCCYECSVSRAREYARQNKDKRKVYRLNNSTKIKEYNSKYSEENKDKINKYRVDNADQIKNTTKLYAVKNADKIKKYKKEWYERNRCKVETYSKKRYSKMKDDVDFKLSKVIRQMLRRVLLITGDEKNDSSVNMLGYDRQHLVNHLESLFVDGMTWDNYGEWHIDHIVPVSKMIEMGVREPHLINAIENLQPLWAYDNLSKGSKC